MRTLTPLGLAVLRLLHSDPMHPYEMQQRIRDWGIDHVVKVTHGALYHTVERLVTDGLIEQVETSRSGRRPERTVYALTDFGREAARGRLNELLSTVDADYPSFRAALSFLSLLTPDEAKARLGMRVVYLESALAATQTAYDALIKNGIPRIHVIEFDHARAQMRAELEVTQSIIGDIDAGRLAWSHDNQPPATRKAHDG